MDAAYFVKQIGRRWAVLKGNSQGVDEFATEAEARALADRLNGRQGAAAANSAAEVPPALLLPAGTTLLPCPLCQDLVAVPAAGAAALIWCTPCARELTLASDRGAAVLVCKNTTQTSFELDADNSASTTALLGTFPIVVGIDFGTARSGYAFAFAADGKIYPRIRWPDQPFVYAKTLTNLLCDPTGAVVAKGYTARKEMAQLRKDQVAGGYQFLEEFKLWLHRGTPGLKPSPQGPILTTPDGTRLPVVRLVAAYLGWLKELALGDLRKATTGALRERDVLWCLTVPALWSDAEKRWMRVAAQDAGLIANDAGDAARLCLVLEPEAAALYVLDQERRAHGELSQFQPGTRFMVVDAGGGTVDITVHEVGKGGCLEEVVPGGGGLHGAAFVDRNFKKYLGRRLGAEALTLFQQEEPLAFLRLMNDWETAKCNFKPGTRSLLLPLPVELYRLLARSDPAVLRRLAAAQEGDDANLQLTAMDVADIFQPVLDGLVADVRDHFRKLGRLSCDFLFLVGGFANSLLLQHRLRNEFGARVRKIIVPPDPGVAVVSGAVAYGLDPARIRVRRSRLTYGCRNLTRFRPGIDPESKKVWHAASGTFFCKHRFRAFVRAGDPVDVNQKVTHPFRLRDTDQDEVTVVFYATRRRKVRYTDEDGVEEIGELTLQIASAAATTREVEITLYFGRAEIAVEAHHLGSGAIAQTRLEFASTFFPEATGE